MPSIRTINHIHPQGLACFSSDYQVAAELATADAIMLRSANLHDFDIPKAVKAIARCGAGVNNIPIERCTKQGVVVFNTPGANANAVKELVLGGMLISARNVVSGWQFIDSLLPTMDAKALALSVEQEKKRFVGSELAGKTLGVIGLGAIGAAVAHAALALGMKVVGFDPALSIQAAWRLSSEIECAEELKQLLNASDYVTLHVPANQHTQGLINGDNTGEFKRGAILLNFARGSIVEEDALLTALDQQHLSLYVTDFPSVNLMKHSKILMLPHLGASTQEAEQNCAVMAARQLIDFLENGNIHNSVNFPSIKLSRSEGYRIAFANDNVPKILSQVLALLSDMNINVVDMLNKSRNDIAYTLMDIDIPATQQMLDAIAAIDHVFHVNAIGEHA
ncbi:MULTISPECIES: 3-phosphoglycerate dehydrogenase family protein [unclassified Agarivorans]|uniref:3-phosphoglycerate dehydrogenase family protein n=1 Tax=unclassified Agarivorans TaxID=2636026 RepID=UPI003D7C8814